MAGRGARTECLLRNDPRLLAGVGAVVSHAAERAGLVEGDQMEFAAAAEEACRETLVSLRRIAKVDSLVQLAVSDFPGRVEVTIEPVGNGRGAKALHGPAAVHAVESVCRTLQRKGIDRVLCETRANSFRMKLIKYCAGTASASAASD